MHKFGVNNKSRNMWFEHDSLIFLFIHTFKYIINTYIMSDTSLNTARSRI